MTQFAVCIFRLARRKNCCARFPHFTIPCWSRFPGRLFCCLVLVLFVVFAFTQTQQDSLLAHLEEVEDYDTYVAISTAVQSIEAAEQPILAEANHTYRLHRFYCRDNHEAAAAPLVSFLSTYRGGLADSSIWQHHMHLAYHYRKLGKFYDAIPHFTKVVDYAEQHDIHPYNLIRHVLMPLGNSYTRSRDHKKAEATLQRAIRLAEAEGSLIRNVNNYGNLGLVYATMGDFDRAIATYNKGLSIEGISPINRVFLLRCRAYSLQESGALAAALTDVETALQLLNTAAGEHRDKPAYQATFLQIKGEIALAEKNYAAAEDNLLQSRQLHLSQGNAKTVDRTLARIEISLSSMYRVQKKYEAALTALDQALQYMSPSFQVTQRWALPSPEQLYTDHVALEVLDARGELFYEMAQGEQAQIEQAIRALLLAQMIEDRLRRTFVEPADFYILQDRSRPRTEQLIAWSYELYQRTQEESYLQLAWQYGERSKARLLTEKIVRRQAQSANGIDSLTRVRALLQEELAELENEIQQYSHIVSEQKDEDYLESLKEKRLRLQTALRSDTEQDAFLEKLPDYAQKNDEATRAIVSQLKKGQVMLSYFVGDKQPYVFRLDAGGHLSLTPLDTSPYLSDFLALWQDQRRWRLDRQEYIRLALGTFQEWLAPVYQTTDRQLLIIPDGKLTYLPFDLLLTKATTETSWAQLPYLLQEVVVQQIYSGQLWLQQLQQRCTQGKKLLIAPVFAQDVPEPIAQLEVEMGPDLAQLPVDSLEVAHDNTWQVLLQQKATKDAFLAEAKDAHLIHLFTHADIGSDDELPWIHFADQVLYFSELNHLRLPADLIILSACETHLGRLEKGEGVLSLSHGFTQAGSASQIASLWRVKALATAQLFNQFYKELAKGSTKAEALRAAKLHYLEHAPDIQRSPAYWGGFVFTGADGPLGESAASTPWIIWWLLAGIGSFIALFWWWRKSNHSNHKYA